MRRAAATLVCGDASLLVASRCCGFNRRCQCVASPGALLWRSRSWMTGCPGTSVRVFGTRTARSPVAGGAVPPSSATREEEEEEEESDAEEWSDGSESGDESQDDGFGGFDGGEKEAEVGDGEDGGGVVLGAAPWGARALDIARRMLTPELALYGFKVCSTGFIQVRLDKLTDRFGSPTIEEVEKFNTEYGALIEEAGRAGLVPANVAIEVSSPGAERVVQIPAELERFKELPMQVVYYADGSVEQQQILVLESFDRESLTSVWKLANVRVNREARGKGRVLNRRQREWRLELAVASIKLVRLHVDVLAEE